MGKPKKGKKGRPEDDFGDELEIDIMAKSEEADDILPQKSGKQKKGKKNKKDNFDEDAHTRMQALAIDSDDDLEGELSDEAVLPQKSKKKDKKKGKRVDESDDDEGEQASPKRPAVKGGFAMLDLGDEGDSPQSSEDEEEVEKKPAKEKDVKKQDSVEEKPNKEQDGENNKQKQQKKGKKEKKKKKNEEEDIDALLAEIEGKTAQSLGMDFKEGGGSGMTEEEMLKAMEAEFDEEEERKGKKKGKKKQQQKQTQVEEEEGGEGESTTGMMGEEGEEGEGADGMMTAAQKKKEKKERQKQKKAEEKAKEKGKKKAKAAEETPETPTEEEMEAVTMETDQTKQETDQSKQEETSAENGMEEKTGEQAEGDDDEDSKKKKKKDRKKKKGEKDKEEEKESKKKTSKMGKIILEQQKKLREEEERIRLEMEEKEQKIEEARRLKEEKEQRDKERKEREKQKKKDKIERQKKEGTFITAKQKEAQRIAQQKLEAMKAQGFEIPSEEGKKKKPVYDSRKKKKQELASQTSQEKEDEKAVTIETAAQEEKEKGSQGEEVKDAWDVSDSEDVKDAWDQESEEEEEPPKQEQEVERQKSVEKEAESEEDEEESGEESSEEESSDDDSDEESSSEDEHTGKENAREKALNRIRKRAEEAEKRRSTDKLRAAVVCVLGHVDTGKTKILDKLRKTNVQDNEAGGITQQIGATNVPDTSIRDSTKMCKEFSKNLLKLPGLLIIDTPGHESFSNLRTRGSSLCDIAILVIDVMHGLEAQTIESINLLKQRKCPFVVALNKIDRLFQWQSNPHSDIVNVIKKQKPNTKQEFDERSQLVKTQLSEQGLNAELFYDNKNPKEYISLVPTSAHSGDGMGNLIALICELSQNYLAKELSYSEQLQATVMEVKALPGLGTTIDVILVNGKLNESDTIVVPGTDGPIVTQLRGLLMPQPMKELRVKNAYVHHKEVMAAQGVKIIAKDLDHSLAGLPMYVAKYADEIDIYKEQLEDALEDILSGIKLQDKGVFVQASTLGSMEALLKFLKDSEIPYAGINIGPVHKRDVMKASVMLDRDPQYAVILAFDVKIERDANDMAESLGIRIFTAEIIYHLFDSFMEYRDKYKKEKQEEFKHVAVFPCKLRVLPQYIFNSRDPIVVGVIVEAGFVALGTPLCVPSKENIHLGQVTSIEVNHKQIEKAHKGQEICIKIENIPGETPKLYGRHFDHTDLLISKISRNSIDAVKNYFRDQMTKSDWHVMVELKKLFQIL